MGSRRSRVNAFIFRSVSPHRSRRLDSNFEGGEKTKKLVVSWLLMWALSYLVVAVVAPGVGGSPVWLSVMEFLVFGVALLAATLLTGFDALASRFKSGKSVKLVARVALVVLAVLSVYSGIATWAGVFIWVVPFANKEVFQVSMAFADLIGAAAMLYLALGDDT